MINNNLYRFDSLFGYIPNMIEIGKELIQIQRLPQINYIMIDQLVNKKQKNKTIRTFEVGLDDFYCEKYYENIIANSYSQARYKFWYEHRDSLKPFNKAMNFIKVRSLGKLEPEYFFGDEYEFNRMKEHRNIPFTYMGMKVEIDGKQGIIMGSNYSFNLDVCFDKNYAEKIMKETKEELTYFRQGLNPPFYYNWKSKNY